VGNDEASSSAPGNDRFGKLDFVEPVTETLYHTVMDDRFGACAPALPGARDLLLGAAASCWEIKTAPADVIREAALRQATLFIYFLATANRSTRTST
jgi:hypothetical protein